MRRDTRPGVAARAALAIAIASAIGGRLLAAEAPADPSKEREWDFLDQGKFHGTLVGIEHGKAAIRMTDGVVRLFEPGFSEGTTTSVLDRAMCRLPDHPDRPALRGGAAPVIELSAQELPLGALSRWPDTGSLGGAFSPMNRPPEVRMVAGRKAVVFAHQPWLLPLESEALVSDFIFPAAELSRGSFTVVAEVVNTGASQQSREALFSWSTTAGRENEGADFSYGIYDACKWYDQRMTFPPEAFPPMEQWHRLVFAVERKGSERNGSVSLLVDGLLVRQLRLDFEASDRKAAADALAFIGCSWEAWWGGAWAPRPARPFTGGIASIRVYARLLVDGAPGPAGAPTAPQPLPGGETATLTPLLAWSMDAGAPGPATVYLSTDRDAVARSVPACSRAAGAGSCQVGPLTRGARYHWKVVPEGAAADRSPIWEFTAGNGAASSPSPAPGVAEVPADLLSLRWKAGPSTSAQRLFFGADRGAVAAGAKPLATMTPRTEEAFISLRDQAAGVREQRDGDRQLVFVPMERLASGTTYWWRVEQVIGSGKDQRVVPGDAWSFTTSPCDLEDDGPVSEPFPADVRQDGAYGRLMRCPGGPIISPPEALDEYLRSARHAIGKLTAKRPDIVQALASSQAACHLATPAHPGWGWSEYTCAAYGNGYAIARRSGIMIHEMGHQFHMNGCEALEPDFRFRLDQIFTANYRDGKWIGDYGSRNKWENVAVWASGWVNDATLDCGVERPRETLRRGDPRMFRFLSDYWPGDTVIELDPLRGVHPGRAGIASWANSGGVEYFQQDAGWRTYRRTVGSFIPDGAPALRTVGGVGAVAFDGASSLRWDQATWDALDGDRSWSVECWVRRDQPPRADEALVEWGDRDATAGRLRWDGGDEAWRFGERSGRWTAKPAAGTWHHVFFVHDGEGGDGRPSTLTVTVDGKQDHRATLALALPPAGRIVVGRGFTGALGYLRIYDYALHPLQMARISAQDGWFAARPAAVAGGALLVDLDAAAVAPYQQDEVWPSYPAALKRPWLRSWANRGILGGRIRTEGGIARQAGPVAGPWQGVPAVAFADGARMASELLADAPAAGTLECWASAQAGCDRAAVVAQYGSLAIPAALVPPGGWHHVAITAGPDGDRCVVDGQPTASSAPRLAVSGGTRLCLGGAWDGRAWSPPFRGAIAQVRVHAGVLDQAAIVAESRRGLLARCAMPVPADGDLVVVEAARMLTWSQGDARAAEADCYLGSDRAAVEGAERTTSGVYQGRHAPGAFAPTLLPGREYFWRVDAVDTAGRALGHGPVWRFRTARGLEVDLDAAGLAPGPVSSWRNRGAAGGSFAPGSVRETWMPIATDKDGRKAVEFTGQTHLLAPPAQLLAGGKPFTISYWVQVADLPGGERERANSVLSVGARDRGGFEALWDWQPQWGLLIAGRKGMATELGYRSGIADATAARAAMPAFMALRWHHVAIAFGGADAGGTLRIAIDGRINRREQVALDVVPGARMCLGGMLADGRLSSGFTGWLGGLAIADRELDDAAIAALAQDTAMAGNAIPWSVLLRAADLGDGPVASWPNRGSLGGAFVLDQEQDHAPVAEDVSGRRAVSFDGKSMFMRSDIPTPASVTGDQPFTVEAMVFAPRYDEVETLFALAPALAMRSYPQAVTARMAYCDLGSARPPAAATHSPERPSAFAAGKYTLAWNDPPPAGRWCQVAWSWSGGAEGAVRCYLDGHLEAKREGVALTTASGYPMHVAAAWNTAAGARSFFAGSIAWLRVYDHVRSEAQIAADARR